MDFINPYEYVGTPQAGEAWETGFCMGFCSPAGYSVQVPHPIDQADLEQQFKEGILDGQTAAAFGWDVAKPPYMEAPEGEGPGAGELSVTGGREVGGMAADTLAEGGAKYSIEAVEVTWTIVKTGAKVVLWANALKTLSVAAIAAMIELYVTGYGLVWTKPVEKTELPDFGERVANYLISRGIHSCAIYMGAAADPKAKGKEIWVTPLFRTQRDASKAAKEIGRKAWIVMEWRTDACESFRIVDGPGW